MSIVTKWPVVRIGLTVLVLVICTAYPFFVKWVEGRDLLSPTELDLLIHAGTACLLLSLWVPPLLFGRGWTTMQELRAFAYCAMGLLALCWVVFAAGRSLFETRGAIWPGWVRASIESGRLFFYASGLALGVPLLLKCRRPATDEQLTLRPWLRAAYVQDGTYAVAFLVLCLSYYHTTAESALIVALLSALLFYIVGDWGIIDSYVIAGESRLGMWDYVRLIVSNALLWFLVLTVLAIPMWPSLSLEWPYALLGGLGLGVVGLTLLCLTGMLWRLGARYLWLAIEKREEGLLIRSPANTEPSPTGFELLHPVHAPETSVID